jgi:hypothetical protein
MMRTAVIVIDMVLGIAAVAGGLGAASGVIRAPAEWLRGAPFKTLLWPGLALLVLVGGSMLAAAAVMFIDLRIGRLVSIEAGIVLIGWSAAMLSAIRLRHWAQLPPFALGIAVAVLSFAVPVPG